MNIDTSGWKEKAAAALVRMRAVLRKGAALVGLYLDDLLMICAGGCFTVGALELGGKSAGLLTAGACLLGYAVIIARARKGGGNQ